MSPVPARPHPFCRARAGARLAPALALLLAAAAASAQTGIDAQENLFGATNINAVSGHGRLTVGVSRDGDVTVLSWPGPSYSDQLAYRSSNDLDARSQPRFGALAGAGVVLGLVLEHAGGEREVSWLRDRQRWSIAQDYGPADGPNPHTRYASQALGLSLEVVDAVAPQADLLLRRVIVERSAGSPVERAWLLTYANLSPVPPDSRLPELPLVDWAKDGANDFAALWDAQQQAVIHFHPAGRRSVAELIDLLLPPAVDWGPLGAQLGQGAPDAAELAALVEGLDADYGAGAYLALSSVPPPDQHQIGIDAAPFCDQFDALAANIQALPEIFPGFEPPIDPAVAGALGCAHSGADIAAAQRWVHRPQDALADAADGALAGSDLAAGEVSEALRTPLAFSPAGRAEAAVLLAAGADPAAARAALAAGADPAAVIERAERTVADWLDGLRIPGAAGSRVRAVARRSLINLRLGTDAASGAVVASIARQPPYAMDWPRDGAFFNVMLDLSGQSALVDRRIALYAEWQRTEPVAPSDIIDPPPPVDPDSGQAETYPAHAWEMNYYADGMVGGTFRFEIDTTAFAVWTMVAHAGWVDAPGEYLERYWPHIRRGADLLARWRDPATGLQAPAQEDDQAAHTQTLHGAIAVFGALDIAARAARRLGHDETALRWEQRAVELGDAIRTHFYDPDAGVYYMTESGRLPIQASGMVPIGPTAWLVWPFALHPWSDEQIQRQLERDWGIVEPVIGLRTAGGLYFMKTTLSLALAGDARFDALRESLPATLAAQATPGTDHFGEVMVVVERDGAPFAEQRVSTPHLWEGALFFLTAAAAEDPQALTRYDAVLPGSRVVDWPRSGGGCGCGRSGGAAAGGWLAGLLLLALLARRRPAAGALGLAGAVLAAAGCAGPAQLASPCAALRPCPAAAAPPPARPLPALEDFFAAERTLGLRLSPAGERVAYRARRHGRPELRIRALDGGGERGLVAGSGEQAIAGIRWSQDGRSLLYLRQQRGEEIWQLRQVRLADGQNRSLLKLGRISDWGGDYLLAQRGDRVLVTANPCCGRRVVEVDLSSGDSRVVLELPRRRVFGFRADESLRVLAAWVKDPEPLSQRAALLLRPDEGSPWRVVRDWPRFVHPKIGRLSADGSRLLLRDNKYTDTRRLVWLRLADGGIEKVFHDPQAEILSVLRDGDRIQAVQTEAARSKWHLLDAELEPDFERLRAELGPGFAIGDRSRDGDRWLVINIQDTRPPQVHLYRRDTGALQQLTCNWPGLAGRRLAPMRPVRIPTRDGLQMVGYLTRPPAGGRAAPPLVVLVHGGPETRDHWGFNRGVQFLASRGYAVLQVNYRGSAGLGKAFLDAGRDIRYGAKVPEDIEDAVAWAARTAGIDPERVALVGGSFGGYAVLAGLAFMPGRYAAGVDAFGVADLVRQQGMVVPPGVSLKRGRKILFDPRRQQARGASPIEVVERIRAPLLVAHGANDPRVSVEQSEDVVAAIRAAGGCVEYVLYPDEGHGFIHRRNRLDFWARVERFLARHLCGAAAIDQQRPGGVSPRARSRS